MAVIPFSVMESISSSMNGWHLGNSMAHVTMRTHAHATSDTGGMALGGHVTAYVSVSGDVNASMEPIQRFMTAISMGAPGRRLHVCVCASSCLVKKAYHTARGTATAAANAAVRGETNVAVRTLPTVKMSTPSTNSVLRTRSQPVAGKTGCLYNLSVHAQWNIATTPKPAACSVHVSTTAAVCPHDSMLNNTSSVNAHPGTSAHAPRLMYTGSVSLVSLQRHEPLIQSTRLHTIHAPRATHVSTHSASHMLPDTRHAVSTQPAVAAFSSAQHIKSTTVCFVTNTMAVRILVAVCAWRKYIATHSIEDFDVAVSLTCNIIRAVAPEAARAMETHRDALYDAWLSGARVLSGDMGELMRDTACARLATVLVDDFEAVREFTDVFTAATRPVDSACLRVAARAVYKRRCTYGVSREHRMAVMWAIAAVPAVADVTHVTWSARPPSARCWERC